MAVCLQQNCRARNTHARAHTPRRADKGTVLITPWTCKFLVWPAYFTVMPVSGRLMSQKFVVYEGTVWQ